MRNAVPTGPPDVVDAWWAGPSPDEQEKFGLAAADKIGTIKGIPDGVPAELTGTDGLNHVKLVRYAIVLWHDTGDDIYPDNCAKATHGHRPRIRIPSHPRQRRGSGSAIPSATQDIMFWSDPGEGIHHASVVTAVVDGQVYYSRHSAPAQNADWNVRETFYAEIGNPQTPIIVRAGHTGD
jgi:hypothetical protein